MSPAMYVVTGGAVVFTLLACVAAGRLFIGPTAADRLVALDTLNTLVVGLLIMIAAITDAIVMVDVAIVYGALSFVGTLFLARYLEGGV